MAAKMFMYIVCVFYAQWGGGGGWLGSLMTPHDWHFRFEKISPRVAESSEARCKDVSSELSDINPGPTYWVIPHLEFRHKRRLQAGVKDVGLQASKDSIGWNIIEQIETQLEKKTSRDRKWLPWIHLIGCRGVNLFLIKDFCQNLFFWLEFEFLSVVTIWFVEFWQSLNFWNLSNFELNFVPIQVFEFCYYSRFLSFVTI